MITAPEPCRPVGGSKDRLDLGPRQKMHLTFVVPFARCRENALDMGAVGRLLEGREAEEGVDGSLRRRLRVLTLTPRFVSSSSRNALIKGASSSSSAKADSGLRSCHVRT